MKKAVLLGVLRHLIIPAGLMWAAGIFYVVDRVMHADTTGHYSLYDHFDAAECKALETSQKNGRHYFDSLYEARKHDIACTGMYMPMDYFHDFKQLEMYEAVHWNELDYFDSVHMNSLSLNRYKTEFASLRDDNWRNLDFDKLPIAGPNQARAFWFPKDAERERISHQKDFSFADEVLMPILGWIWWSYKRGFLFAFVMLLIWRLRLKEQLDEELYGAEKRRANLVPYGPLSFMISVLMWPVVLVADICNRFSQTLRRADMLSRRETMLGLFSQVDRKLVDAGMEMSRKEFRSYLDSIGLARQHSFKKALLVTVFVTLIIPRTYAALSATQHDASCKARIACTTHAPDRDIGVPAPCCEACMPTAAQIVAYAEQKEKNIFHFPRTVGRILTGHAQSIDGVPKIAVIF